MIFGAITNSWRQQLDGQDLAALIQEAQTRGARHIELRQTCLGNYESGEGEHWRPVLSRLEALVQEFPGLSFDLAMAWPCLTQKTDPSGEQFQAALRGAKLVGRDTPHLRIVDPAAFDSPWETPADLPAAALSVADLAQEAARQGVILSMENSGQPIRSMALLVRQARARLTPEAGGYLGLCPDPTNQLRRYPHSDPLAELEALPADMIKIVHFKQARGGRAHLTVDTGDLDCARMWQILEAKGFQGAAVMEIPPDAQVFDHLSSSFAFLAAVAGDR
ncbi:MAG TPA: TIM barrel protein [Candidatus Tectomicrobia bacterium]|jgi:sugar phosphate isomerase/epimerase